MNIAPPQPVMPAWRELADVADSVVFAYLNGASAREFGLHVEAFAVTADRFSRQVGIDPPGNWHTAVQALGQLRMLTAQPVPDSEAVLDAVCAILQSAADLAAEPDGPRHEDIAKIATQAGLVRHQCRLRSDCTGTLMELGELLPQREAPPAADQPDWRASPGPFVQ